MACYAAARPPACRRRLFSCSAKFVHNAFCVMLWMSCQDASTSGFNSVGATCYALRKIQQ